MEQKFVFTFYVCVYTHTCVQVCHNVHLEARDQLLEVHSFLPIVWIPAIKLILAQTWWQVPSSMEPFQWMNFFSDFSCFI